ncbi:MAG TPA: RcpC/CpaB family pilus assembly protein, partial [Alphaproteobacteria bacterium]
DPTGQINDMIELNLDKMATETILQNVRVIAVGEKYKDAAAENPDAGAKPAKAASKKAPKVKTVTLEVDPRGAEVLALAKDMGKLLLSLRKLGDDKYFDHNYGVITDEKLTKITDEIYGNIQSIQKTSGQNGNIVRIYNGYQQEQVRVVP